MAVETGAIIAGAASLIGSGVNAYAQGKMNKRAEKAMDKQRGWYLSDWEKQNAYNHPSQQMQRLREAGLNPHLIYGGGQPTNTSSGISSTNINPYTPGTPDIGAMLASPVNAYLEARQIDAQNKLINAQVLKTLAETNTTNFDLSQKERLADTQASIINEILTGHKLENVFKRDENLRRNVTTSSNLQEAFMRMQKTASDIDLQSMMRQKGNEEIKSIQQMRDKVAAEISNLNKDGKLKDFEIKLNDAGFTKSDPVYFRMAKTIYDAMSGQQVNEQLEDIRKDLMKNKPSVGLSVLDALKNVIYSITK